MYQNDAAIFLKYQFNLYRIICYKVVWEKPNLIVKPNQASMSVQFHIKILYHDHVYNPSSTQEAVFDAGEMPSQFGL